MKIDYEELILRIVKNLIIVIIITLIVYLVPDDIEKIKKIRTKTLIMTGSNDSGSTVAMSKSLSNDLINSNFVEINNGKHLCSIECADDVNINLKKFINN